MSHVSAKGGCRTYLCNVPIERERIGDGQNKQDNHRSSISKKPKKRLVRKRREYRGQNMRNRVANDDAERDHAPECKGPLSYRYSNQSRFSEAMLHCSLEGI